MGPPARMRRTDPCLPTLGSLPRRAGASTGPSWAEIQRLLLVSLPVWHPLADLRPGRKDGRVGEVTDLIASLDEPQSTMLERLRARTVELVPEAEEGRSYGMPALRYRGRPLVSVVAAKHGYSLFPFSSDVVARAVAALDGFDSTKGGIKFTDERPIPDHVFEQIVLSRRDEIDGSGRR